MIAAEVRFAVAALLNDYARCLDEDRLEDWVELFTDDCLYKVLSRENVAQDLPVSLLEFENKAMLHDRIAYLREASVYNIHTDRHVIGPARISIVEPGAYAVETSYAAYQSNQSGESWLYSVGLYRDLIVFDREMPKFKEKVVIVDTFAIATALSTPI